MTPAPAPRPDPRRLLFVIRELTSTGACIALLDLVEALVAGGRQATIVTGTLAAGQDDLADAFVRAGAAVRPRVEPDRFDAVIVSTLVNLTSARYFAGRKPTLWWLHEGELARDILARDADAREALDAVDRIVVPSAAIADAVYRPLLDPARRNRLAVVPNGVAMRDAVPPPVAKDRPVRITAVGTVYPRKRQADLIEAVLALGAHGIDPGTIQCLILGKAGPQSAHVAALAAVHAPLVRLVGTLPPAEVHAVLRETDVLSLPSADECFPLAPLEAGLYGVPPVLSDIAAHRGVWRHGESALLHRVGDVARLAACLARLIADPDLRARLGRAARGVAAAYTRERFAQGFIDVIRDTAAAFAARSARP